MCKLVPLILSVSLAVVATATTTCCYPWNPSEQISEYLEMNVRGDDLEANMVEAEKWLAALVAKRTTTQYYDRSPGSHEPLIEALRKFIALRDLQRTKCTQESYKILRDMDILTEHRTRTSLERMGPLLRVERVLLKCAVKHLRECQPHWPAALEAQRQQMDPVYLERLDNFMSETVYEALEATGVPKGAQFDSNQWDAAVVKELLQWETVRKFFHLFEDEFKNSRYWRFFFPIYYPEDDQLYFNTKAVETLILEYTIEPCKEYLERAGQEVFVPAEYDGLLSGYWGIRGAFARPFKSRYFAYRACRLVTDQRYQAHFVDIYVKSVIHIVNEEFRES